jgi:oxygen-independent coproporphyrinogen-3 oxidase
VHRSEVSNSFVQRYQKALLLSWEFWKNKEGAFSKIGTIYFGGGTPSLYPAEKIQEFLDTVRNHADVEHDAEVTLEVDPKTIRRPKLEMLKAAGINRVSLGVQSFQDPVLEKLGRYHRQKDILSCYEDCRTAGFKNVSIDLMYGVPGQTWEFWENDLRHVQNLNPEHVSLYSLNLMRGTDFFRKRKILSFPPEPLQEKFYKRATKVFKELGIFPYEISNFSKKGFESRHNSDCWNRKPYLGLGVGASSFLRRKRWRNIQSLHAYVEKIEQHENAVGDTETLSTRVEKIEFVLLQLRKTRGFLRAEYERLFGCGVEEDFPALLAPRLRSLLIQGPHIRLTVAGRNLSSEVFQELF